MRSELLKIHEFSVNVINLAKGASLATCRPLFNAFSDAELNILARNSREERKNMVYETDVAYLLRLKHGRPENISTDRRTEIVCDLKIMFKKTYSLKIAAVAESSGLTRTFFFS